MGKDSTSQSTFLILKSRAGRDDCRDDLGTGGGTDEFNVLAESITIPVSSFARSDPRPVHLICLPLHSGLPCVNARHQVRPSHQ